MSNKRSVPINRPVSSNWNERVQVLPNFYVLCFITNLPKYEEKQNHTLKFSEMPKNSSLPIVKMFYWMWHVSVSLKSDKFLAIKWQTLAKLGLQEYIHLPVKLKAGQGIVFTVRIAVAIPRALFFSFRVRSKQPLFMHFVIKRWRRSMETSYNPTSRRKRNQEIVQYLLVTPRHWSQTH